MAKVSIITINLNNINGLKETYKSVSEQTFQDKEWIVIDGGSTKGDCDFIEQHQDEMSFWCSEPDGGIYNAINKGILHANGDYLICMNSGDTFYDKNVLEHVFEQELYGDVVYGDWIQSFPNGEKKEYYAPKTFSLHFITHNNICHQAIFTRTEIMKKSLFNENYSIYADWAKWIELTLKKCTFQYIPFFICYFDMCGLSQTSDKIGKEKELLLEWELSPAIKETLRLINEYNSLKQVYTEQENKLNETLSRCGLLEEELNRFKEREKTFLYKTLNKIYSITHKVGNK